MAGRPGRVTGKAARRNKWYTKRRNQWISGGVLAALAIGGGTWIVLDDSSSSPGAVKLSEGDKWKDAIVGDFGPMSQGAVTYLKTMNDWRTGDAKAAAVDASADVAFLQFLDARELLAGRVAFPQAPRALADYRDAVELYVAHARLAKLGVAVKDDADLNGQIQLMMGRIRYLADRLYDLGGDEMKPYTIQDTDVPGFEYARTVDVPSFGGTDLAPGPPLSQLKPGVAAKREYQNNRPDRPFDEWKAIVEGTKIPSAQAEAKAIKDADVDELDQLSQQLTKASDDLYAAPDPTGERVLNTRVQLGLLVQAEAMRAAQISRLGPEKNRGEALEIAQVLALLGNRMWDDRLGARALGFPETLLTTRPKVAPKELPEPTTPPSTDPSSSPNPAATSSSVSPEPSTAAS